MIASYGLFDEFQGWGSGLFKSLIAECASKRILEIGSGANSTLAPADFRAGGLSYVTSDPSSEELEKADGAFERLVLDLSIRNLDPVLTGRYNFVFSRMVAEHVKDGSQYYGNSYKIAAPGRDLVALLFDSVDFTFCCQPLAA